MGTVSVPQRSPSDVLEQGQANEVMQDAEVVSAYLGKPAYA